jgi:hypothetical protein
MTNPLKPAPGRFVVRAPKGAGATTVASQVEAATIEPLAGDPDALLVTFDRAPANAAAALQRAVGPGVQVLPVLEDASGASLYPTGRVTVRFKKPVEEPELRRFAAKHDLALVAKNEFQPQQATFVPRDLDARWFPDAVTEADADDDVATAWPETRSAYRKTD